MIGQTIGDLFDGIAMAHTDHEALVSRHQGIRWSYGELHHRTDELARALRGLGIRKGDRVGIWSPNNAEWVLAQFATPKIGAILVNLNSAYRTSELAYALNQSGCRALILAPSFKSSDYLAMLTKVRAQCLDLEVAISLGEQEHAGFLSWAALLAKAKDVTNDELRQAQTEQQFDDAINIQYTSGTTGFPKGATLSHHNILNNGYFIGEAMRLTLADRLCIPVPFYHCFGMVLGNLACVTHASTMVIPSEAYDPLAVLEAIQAERCTALHGVPTMFIGELDHARFAEFDLSSLRTGIMAGSPCPVEVMKRVQSEMHMTEVTICYGMTETSPVSFQSLTDDPLDKRVCTVGRIHPHVECKIVDGEGNILPRGEPGELLSRGYLVMLGYWNNAAATAEAIDAARWMHTGDLATMDEEGYVNIVGRIKDMIIRGGENVYPREIEEFLCTHPGIADVQVVGLPDERYGEEVCAWVRIRDGHAATAGDIRDFCKGKIAHYKVPRYIKFVDGFPMTITGKVQKFKMRELAVEEFGKQAAAAVQTA